MCGIAGYIGNKNVSGQLVGALKLLEYRGYDSAGVAILENDEICLTKTQGKILNLQNLLKQNGEFSIKDQKDCIGIAHTRWATHGEPSEQNAHPHLSCNKEWAVVHNGIIENFDSLKKSLINQGFKFKSQTDTEVIAQMLQYLSNSQNVEQTFNLNKIAPQILKRSTNLSNCCNNKDNLKTVINTCKKLKGSFALAILNKNDKNTIYLAKNKSPLFVAKSLSEIFIASDPICFEGKVNEYFSLEDNEFCKAQKTGLFFCDKDGKQIQKRAVVLKNINTKNNKKKYKHFMIKEIKETPSVLKTILDVYKNNRIFSKIDKQLLLNIKKVVLIGCGTAYHASLMGAEYIKKICRIEAHAFVASEFRYSNPILDKNTLVVLVSQSGETADTLLSQELVKGLGAKTIALTNVLHSSLAKKTDFVFPVCAGPEIAVASTKAYTAQICILYMFAKYLSNIKNNTSFNFFEDITNLSKNLKCTKSANLKRLSKLLSKEDFSFFIGKGLDYITSEEASLKLKEITYINSQAYPAGELKHGFLALVTKGTYVFVVATQKKVLEKTLNSASEALSRGAKLVVASQYKISKRKLKDIFAYIPLKKFSEDLMPICSIVSFQILSYLTSIERKINPDQPRNLAKSVTVE